MKIKKSVLIGALEKAKPFCGKSFEILENVLIDGPAGEIVATDIETTVVVPIVCEDFTREIAPDVEEIVFPDEDLRADMMSLKKDQLDDLAEYAGVPTGKKAEIVEAIMAASLESAEAAKTAQGEPVVKQVGERFAVDPCHLLKIVKSLSDFKDDDLVDLSVDEFTYDDDLLDDLHAATLSVCGNFQQLTLAPVSEFPRFERPETNRAFARISAETLGHVVSISNLEKKVEAFKRLVLFDVENQNIVATDGKRLYAASHDLGKIGTNLQLPGETLKQLCKVARGKSIDINVDADGGHIQLNAAGISVFTKNDTDSKYPGYMDLLSRDMAHNVLVDKKLLQQALDQAMVISDATVEITFNGGVQVAAAGEAGVYHREKVPFLKDVSVDPPVQGHFNPRFLADAIKCMSEKVMVRLTDTSFPFFFQRENTFQACIMPQKD